MNQALDTYERLKDIFLSCTGSCLKSSSTLTLNGRRFKVSYSINRENRIQVIMELS